MCVCERERDGAEMTIAIGSLSDRARGVGGVGGQPVVGRRWCQQPAGAPSFKSSERKHTTTTSHRPVIIFSALDACTNASFDRFRATHHLFSFLSASDAYISAIPFTPMPP